MLVVTRAAIHSSTSGSPISKPSHLTCLRRMAMRVSRSGRLMSTTTPWPKRELEALEERLQFARRPVAGDHDLLAGFVERVEGVEELDLRLLLLGQELDVVDQQHVVLAIGLLEALDAILVGDRVD